MAIMLVISPKNLDVLKYLGGLPSHPGKKVMLFMPRTVDKACVHAQYLENIGYKKGKPSGSKQKEHREASKEGNKWKGGKDKKTTTTAHRCKDPNNHCTHCNIDGHTEKKCWKLHSKLKNEISLIRLIKIFATVLML
jgi:hypothetical protein